LFEETRESTGISDWEKLLADGKGEEGMTQTKNCPIYSTCQSNRTCPCKYKPVLFPTKFIPEKKGEDVLKRAFHQEMILRNGLVEGWE
jgi:hypothetical protein